MKQVISSSLPSDIFPKIGLVIDFKVETRNERQEAERLLLSRIRERNQVNRYARSRIRPASGLFKV